MSDLPMKTCPGCRKKTRFDSKVCPKCGHTFRTIFSMHEIESAGEEKAGMPLGVWIAISVIVMLLMGLIVVWHQSQIASKPKPAPVKVADVPHTPSQMEGMLRANMTPATITDAIGEPDVKQKSGEPASHDEIWLYHCKGGDLRLHLDGTKGLDNWQTQ